MRIFKNRTVGFWFGLFASGLMLISNLGFIMYDNGDRTFSYLTFSLIMIGVLCQLLVITKNYSFAPILPPIFFGGGLAVHLYLGLPTLSDVVNGVNFIGGNPTAVMAFGVPFIVGTIVSIIASFMEHEKHESLIVTSKI